MPLPQIRYFTSIHGNGWYHVRDDGTADVNIDREDSTRPVTSPNTNDALRIILDNITPAGAINGGGGDDEFYIHYDIFHGAQFHINDPTGANTVIFMEDFREVRSTTAIDHSIRFKTIALRADDPNIADITVTVTRVFLGRSSETREYVVTSTDSRDITFAVSNVMESPGSTDVTKIQFESGPLAQLGAVTAQRIIDYVTPEFTETSYATEILRSDVSAETPILTVSGTDEDGGLPLSYLIVGGNDHGYFDIRSRTGALVFNPDNVDALKADTTRQHTLTVRIHDGANFSDVEVVITLTLEQIRYFPSGPDGAGWYYTLDTDSTTPREAVTSLDNVEAERIIIDANTPAGLSNKVNGGGGNDVYYIEHNAVTGVEIDDTAGTNIIMFAADKTDGTTTTSISVKGVASIPQQPRDVAVTLTITTDDGNAASTRDVRLIAHDVVADPITGAVTRFAFEGGDVAGRVFTADELRDYASGTPTFAQESYSVEISEDREISADNSVITVSAFDTDSGSTLRYSITRAVNNVGNAVSIFDIDANGAITLKSGATLDRETHPFYTLTVRASDGAKHSDVLVTVDIGDVDEDPHSFHFLDRVFDSIREQTIPQEGGPLKTAIRFTMNDADDKVFTADDFAVHRVRYIEGANTDVGVDARFDVVADGLDGNGNIIWRVVVVPGATLDYVLDSTVFISIVAYDNGEAVRTPTGSGVADATRISVPTSGFANSNPQAEFEIRSDGVVKRTPRVEETLTVYVTADDFPHGNGTLMRLPLPDGTITGGATFQWYYTRDGVTVKIDGATSASYTLGEETIGAWVSVDVQYTDGGGLGRTPTGEYARATYAYRIEKANQAPTLSFTGAATIAEGTSTVGGITFTASDPDPVPGAAGLMYSLVNAPAGWNIHGVSGAITFNGTLDYENILPDPTNGNKRGQELTVRVTDAGEKYTEVTIFVEVTNVEEGPATLRINLPTGNNAGSLDGGEILTLNLSQDDPDGYATNTSYIYKWYRVVDGVEEANAIHTGTTYVLQTANDLSTDTKRVDLIVRGTYTDGFGKIEAVEARINSIGRDVEAQIGFTPSVARDALTTGENVALNIIAEDPNGYKVGTSVVYEWYRVVNGVEGATPIEATSGLTITDATATALDRDPSGVGIRDLAAADVSSANTRVDLIFRLTYTDGYGREVILEERLNHIGIAAPATNTDPAFDATITSFSIDEGTHDNIMLHTVSASDPEKDSLTLSLATAPTGYSLVDNGDGTADIFFTGTIAEGAADGTLTVMAEDLEGNTATQALTIQINQLPQITVTGRAQIPENTDYSTTAFQISGAAGAPVTITASDGDNDTLTYSLADDTPAGFDIDPNTGAITYNGGAFNFEDYASTNGIITLVVEVDDGRAETPTTHDVEVQIVDAQEGEAEIRLNTNAPFVGEELRIFVDVADPEGNGDIRDATSASYQWYSKTGDAARTPISGATAATYIVPEGSAGKIFSVEITYTDGGGFENSANPITATTTTGAVEGTLTLDSRFIDNGNPIPFEIDVDGAWSTTGNSLPKYVFARYTGDPTLTVSYINKAGREIDVPIIHKDSFDAQRDVPPYWLGFDLTYDGREISLDFDSFFGRGFFDTGNSDDSIKGPADTLLPTGILQDFTITATYGAASRTVDFQLRLVDDDDPIDTGNPFVTQSGHAYRENLAADEAFLQADSTARDYDDGARSGTFYINDFDEGDSYSLQVNIGAEAVTVEDGMTETITTNQGTFTITTDSKQVDWTYAYKSADLGNGERLTDNVQITVTDTLESGTSTATRTPLNFALQTHAEGPVYTKSAYSFDVPEGMTNVGTITLSSNFPTDFSITAGNGNNLFAIDDDGVITLNRALDFESDMRQYMLTVEGTDRNGTLPVQVTINLENVDESRSTFTITGVSDTDSTDTELANLVQGWTLSVALDTADAEGVKDTVPPVYRWFYASDPDGNIGTDSTSYTVTAADAGEVIGVGVTYTDNNNVSFEVITMLDAVNEVGFIVPSPDEENIINIPGTQGMEVDAGDGSDTITSGDGDDTIIGGLGDDVIDLGTGDDKDTVIYTIGGQTAQDGGDDITNFNRGKDKFVFSLESNADTMAITNLDELFTFINKGTEDNVYDDEFLVQLDFDFSNGGVSLDGVNFHFNDGVFYSGGRISMPIVEIDFAESSVIDGVRAIANEVFGSMENLRAGLNPSKSVLTNLDHLNALFGGDDQFEAIGFQLATTDIT